MRIGKRKWLYFNFDDGKFRRERFITPSFGYVINDFHGEQYGFDVFILWLNFAIGFTFSRVDLKSLKYK